MIKNPEKTIKSANIRLRAAKRKERVAFENDGFFIQISGVHQYGLLQKTERGVIQEVQAIIEKGDRK